IPQRPQAFETLVKCHFPYRIVNYIYTLPFGKPFYLFCEIPFCIEDYLICPCLSGYFDLLTCGNSTEEIPA
ncbi:MAG: hypothetical protein DRP87_09690, partial [Spirochaetes bacterium]